MQNDLEPLIEKYRHELMEYSRNNPRFAEPQPEPMQEQETPAEVAEEKMQIDEPVEDRIRPGGKLYRADFDGASVVPVSMDMRRDNVADRERETVPPAQNPGQDNERERIVSEASEGNPPYNNGTVTEFQNKDAFLESNQKNGFLRVQVSAADQAFPIQNADVIVSKRFGNDDSVFFEEHTDASGIINRVTLPAPDRILSGAPSSVLQPYSTYDISVTHPGFVSVLLKNAVIFDGIETIQQVVLIPSVPGVDLPPIVENEEGEN